MVLKYKTKDSAEDFEHIRITYFSIHPNSASVSTTEQIPDGASNFIIEYEDYIWKLPCDYEAEPILSSNSFGLPTIFTYFLSEKD